MQEHSGKYGRARQTGPIADLYRQEPGELRNVNHLLKLLVGERNLGRLEYLLRPRLRNGWRGPFNGQQYRHRIFFGIFQELSIRAIIETGTYRGSTTALFAATGCPVYSVEACPRYFAYAQMRFSRDRGRVHLYQSDSRDCLAGFGPG